MVLRGGANVAMIDEPRRQRRSPRDAAEVEIDRIDAEVGRSVICRLGLLGTVSVDLLDQRLRQDVGDDDIGAFGGEKLGLGFAHAVGRRR